MLQRQHESRVAADLVTDTWMGFPEVRAVAVIGSVAKALWKEVPRFREFRREGIEVWHEWSDLDLALWLDSQERLGKLRSVAVRALRTAYDKTGLGVANHQLDVFLIEPDSNRYLGRLCSFNECPKGKPECHVTGCGVVPFNKQVAAFTPDADFLAPARHAMLYERSLGRLRSALDLPST